MSAQRVGFEGKCVEAAVYGKGSRLGIGAMWIVLVEVVLVMVM